MTMTDRLREAARNRQRAIEAVQEASAVLEEERSARLAEERPVPVTTAEPPPEGPLPAEEAAT